MAPEKTIELLGGAAIAKASRFDAAADFGIDGCAMNDLAVLAARLEKGMTDANELRDWQNRINLILDRAVDLTPDYESMKRNGWRG